jgi:starch synthase
MKILFAASEAVPFAATGGLADVVGSLPRALKTRRTDCRVVLPLYGDISPELRGNLHYLTNFEVPVAWRKQYCGVFETVMNGVTCYLIDNEYYFKRRGLYGYYDDAERFAFFSRAVLEMLDHIDFKPDIIHANDWHTALIPALLKIFYSGREEYQNIKCVFTIHSVQYQGVYGKELLKEILGVPEDSYEIFMHKGDLNFMKAGVVTADAVTAVSPTYAQELKDPYFSFGMDPIFNSISDRLTGILNGIDTVAYNPKTDQNIFQKYDADDLAGKVENRRGLQKMLGLPEDDDVFIIAIVSRLVEAKGIDLVRYAMNEILSHHVQFVLLGKGEWIYESYFAELAKRFPGRLSVRIGFMNDLAHKIYAGADALLMPSKFEPCGLSQMAAMRYGTIPIVHEIGGLKDSVIDCGNKNGNGFTFQSFNAEDMLDAIVRAETMHEDRDSWQSLVKRDITSDFSWKKSAKSYQQIYKTLLAQNSKLTK